MQNLTAAAVLVALIAIDAVVDVTVHALMVLIGLRLLVAVRALEHRVVVRVRVARRTNTVSTTVISREVSVIKGRASPGCGRVASCAGCREARRSMVRIGRALVILLMAPVAVGGQGRVVIVHVTVHARNGGVRTGQRERCVVVIEAGVGPRCGAVTDVACGRKTDLGVVRVVGVVVIGLMATDASGVGAGQLVVAIHMALLAGHGEVETGQGPASGRVNEATAAPIGRRMALVAGGREAGLNMVWVRGAVEIVQVAGDARAAGQLVVVVHVAL